MAGNAQIEMDQSRAPSLGAELVDQPDISEEKVVDLSKTTVMQAVEAATAAQPNIEETPKQEQNRQAAVGDDGLVKYGEHLRTMIADQTGQAVNGDLEALTAAVGVLSHLECENANVADLCSLGSPVTEEAKAASIEHIVG